MGRLQRKKTIKKKKKKITSEDQRDVLAAESSKDSHLPSTATFRPSNKEPGAVAKRFQSPQLKKPKFVDDSIQFLREVKIELKKVTWPSRKQAMGSTSVVIILVFIFAIYFGIVDAGLSGLVRLIY